MTQNVDSAITAAQIPKCHGIEVGGSDHREKLNVHDQNAQQGEPEQQIQRADLFLESESASGTLADHRSSCIRAKQHVLCFNRVSPILTLPATGTQTFLLLQEVV